MATSSLPTILLTKKKKISSITKTSAHTNIMYLMFTKTALRDSKVPLNHGREVNESLESCFISKCTLLYFNSLKNHGSYRAYTERGLWMCGIFV